VRWLELWQLWFPSLANNHSSQISLHIRLGLKELIGYLRLFRSYLHLVLLGFALLLAGCGPSERTPTPFPTLQSLRVAFSPDTRPALPALEQCAEDQPGLAMLADEKPVTLMESSDSDVWIRLGIPDNWGGFAAQLAEERIVLVANPDNPIRSLSLEEVQGIFSGQLQSWSQVGGPELPVHVWVFPPADEARQISDQNLLAGLSVSDQAFLAASPRRMLEAIANDPGAVGYLPHAWTDATVKLIPLPINQQAAMTRPVLVLSSSEPEGQVREFVVCLQSGAGQEALSSLYEP
jgi:PBP superfamily domain